MTMIDVLRFVFGLLLLARGWAWANSDEGDEFAGLLMLCCAGCGAWLAITTGLRWIGLVIALWEAGRHVF